MIPWYPWTCVFMSNFHVHFWGFPQMEVYTPISGWYILESPTKKEWFWGTPVLGKPHIKKSDIHWYPVMMSIPIVKPSGCRTMSQAWVRFHALSENRCIVYPLVNIHIAMENQLFPLGKLIIKHHYFIRLLQPMLVTLTPAKHMFHFQGTRQRGIKTP